MKRVGAANIAWIEKRERSLRGEFTIPLITRVYFTVQVPRDHQRPSPELFLTLLQYHHCFCSIGRSGFLACATAAVNVSRQHGSMICFLIRHNFRYIRSGLRLPSCATLCTPSNSNSFSVAGTTETKSLSWRVSICAHSYCGGAAGNCEKMTKWPPGSLATTSLAP